MREQIKLTPDAPLKTVSLDWAAGYLGIHNLTPYPIYVTYGVTPPSASTYDLLIPAATVMSAPLPGNQTYSFFMDTSGVAVTFSSPPAVLTLDSEPVNYGFSQVHLTYPFSNNLQFLARTKSFDQYVNATCSPGVTSSPLSLTVPSGQLYIIRRVMARALNCTTTNNLYIQVNTVRRAGVYDTLFYHYFSAVENEVWKDLDGLTLVCSRVGSTWNIQALVHNFSASSIRLQVKLKIDVVEASLP